MPYVASIGTYLPCWGTPDARVAGDDDDAITPAVAPGRAAPLTSETVERVGFVSRDMPPWDSGGAAVRPVGPGLDPDLEVDELGGAPATIDGARRGAQCVELAAQPRGGTVNQMDGARIALPHTVGGPTAVSAVTILEGGRGGAR